MPSRGLSKKGCDGVIRDLWFVFVEALWVMDAFFEVCWARLKLLGKQIMLFLETGVWWDGKY